MKRRSDCRAGWSSAARVFKVASREDISGGGVTVSGGGVTVSGGGVTVSRGG